MGTTFYVKTNGNDAADGLTHGSALASLTRASQLFNGQSAATQANSVTVLIDNGTYNEPDVFFNPALGSNGGILTIAPLNPQLGGPTVSGMPVKIICTKNTGLGVGGIYIDNVAARTQDAATSQVCGSNVFGLEVTDGSTGQKLVSGIEDDLPNTTVQACYVHDINIGNVSGATGGAIDCVSAGNGNDFGYKCTGNLVIHNGPIGGSLYHGIYIGCPYAYIANNISGNNPGGSGIKVDGGATFVTIINNTTFNNQFDGINVAADTIASVHNRIYNNICYANGAVGIQTTSANPGSVDYTDCSSNISYLNTTANFNFHDVTTFNNFNAIQSDPLFVNYQSNGTGDYHLTASSPGVDGGTGVSAPSVDFAGTLRPLGYNYDIGAYEFIPGFATMLVQDNSGNILMALGPQGTGESFITGQSQYVGANDSVEAAITQSRNWYGNVDPLTRSTSPGPQDGDLWFNDSPASTSQNQTVGDQNTPGSYANWYAGPNNQKWIQWPCNITGTIISISLYDDGVGSTASATWGCVWSAGGTLLGNTSKGLFSGGSKTIKGQHWHTLSGISVAVTSGTTYRIGWQNDGNLNAWSCYSDNEAPFTGFGYASGSTSGPSNLGSASTPVENKPMGVYFVVQTSATTQVHIALLRNGAWVTIVT